MVVFEQEIQKAHDDYVGKDREIEHLKRYLKESYNNETNLQKKDNIVKKMGTEIAKENSTLKAEAERVRKTEEEC